MDRLVDLLSAAGGRTGGTEPGQVFGARSLRTRDTLDSVDSLIALGTVAIADYRSTGYQADFGFIDHILPVYDEALEDRLRSNLFDDLLSVHDNVDVLLPDDLVPFEDERSICYIVRPRESIAKAYDMTLTVEMISAMLRDHDVTSLDLELRFSDSSRNELARASILDCLAAELELDGARFIAYDGDFYRIDGSLLDRVDDALSAIPTATLDVPCYPGGTEPHWNQSVAQAAPERLICLDGRLIRLAGETPFEACDVLDLNGTLIHAKRKSRSSTMSHLFVQAERSCQLLADLQDARTALQDLILAAAAGTELDVTKALQLAESLGDRDHGVRVVFALLGDWHRRDLRNLPLLAKLTLVTTVSAIKRLGFDVAVQLVPLCSRP